MSSIRSPHPDAIQTIYGWALPSTGEILDARKDLPNPVDGFNPGQPFIQKKVVEVPEINLQLKNDDPVGEEPKPTRRRKAVETKTDAGTN